MQIGPWMIHRYIGKRKSCVKKHVFPLKHLYMKRGCKLVYKHFAYSNILYNNKYFEEIFKEK